MGVLRVWVLFSTYDLKKSLESCIIFLYVACDGVMGDQVSLIAGQSFGPLPQLTALLGKNVPGISKVEQNSVNRWVMIHL